MKKIFSILILSLALVGVPLHADVVPLRTDPIPNTPNGFAGIDVGELWSKIENKYEYSRKYNNKYDKECGSFFVNTKWNKGRIILDIRNNIVLSIAYEQRVPENTNIVKLKQKFVKKYSGKHVSTNSKDNIYLEFAPNDYGNNTAIRIDGKNKYVHTSWLYAITVKIKGWEGYLKKHRKCIDNNLG